MSEVVTLNIKDTLNDLFTGKKLDKKRLDNKIQ